MQDKKIITTEEKGRVIVVRIVGELDSFTISEVKDVLSNLIDSHKAKIAIDCEKIEHMNSTSIGVLVGRLKEARAMAGDIRLFNLTPHIQKIFDMIGASKIFNMYLNEEEALADF